MTRYSAEIKVWATVYVDAECAALAREKIAALAGVELALSEDGDTVDGSPFEYIDLSSPSLSPACTIDGDLDTALRDGDVEVSIDDDGTEPELHGLTQPWVTIRDDCGGYEHQVHQHDYPGQEPDGWCAYARDAQGVQVGEQRDFDTEELAEAWLAETYGDGLEIQSDGEAGK